MSRSTTPQTVAMGMKTLLAVLWEMGTFKKPCEGPKIHLQTTI